MSRLNPNFDLTEIAEKYNKKLHDVVQVQPFEPSDVLESHELLSDFIDKHIVPEVLSNVSDKDDPVLVNSVIWIGRLNKLNLGLTRAIRKLISLRVPENIVRYMVIQALHSLGSIGAKKIYEYLFGKKKRSHIHILKRGTEVKLLKDIFEDSSIDDIQRKINEVLKTKYDYGIVLRNIIRDINIGKYDKYIDT